MTSDAIPATICGIPMTQDEYYDLQAGDRFTWMGGEPYPFPVYEVLAGSTWRVLWDAA
jgi:hypothetical protein